MSQILTSTPDNMPKYFDLIQCDPDNFNEKQKIKQNEYVEKYGKEALQRIKWSDKHHELKAKRSKNYALTNEEFFSLKKNGILIKELAEPTSFPKLYLDLYNNDMPVMITSDSMLFAIHKFYNNMLKKLESNKLLSKLKAICNLLLDELYTITPTELNQSYLTKLEVFFMIPKVILDLNKELSDGVFTETSELLYNKEEIKEMLNKKEITDKNYHQFDYEKMVYFLDFIGLK